MKVTIATRGSELALYQANFVSKVLRDKHPELKVELNVIKTMGDKILDQPLAKIGGKGLFVKEIEQALIDGTADIAVHSMKDVPIHIPEGLEMYVNPKGESPHDAFLSLKYENIRSLPEGAVVGTSSLRRKIQLQKIAPHVVTKDLRGNVNTRIRKLEEGEYDAIILAQAGLNRLNLMEHVKETIAIDDMLPAVCQGILGIEVRADDTKTKALLEFLKDVKTEYKVTAERAYLRKLEGGCQAPIGCYAVVTGDQINVRGFLASLDGSIVLLDEMSGKTADAGSIGVALAEKVLAAGGDKILKEIYG